MKRKQYSLKLLFYGILFLCSLNSVLKAQTVAISSSGPTSFCKGGSVTLCASGANSYIWNVDSTTSCITVNKSGTYAVSGTLANGNIESASIVVTVNACGIILTKTPNVSSIENGTLTSVNFTYSVTNKGTLFNASGTVKDDNGTPGNTADDVVVCNYSSLAPGASTSCTRSFSFSNTHTNVAIASGSTGNVQIADTAMATVLGVPCGVTLSYPDNSNLPRSAVVFNESTVLRASEPGLTNCAKEGSVIKVWYNDEHALTLGVRRVNIKTSSGITTTDYPITPAPTIPGTVYFPLVGDTISSGDQNGNDVAAGGGRPLWPAIFLTDLTVNGAASRIGDWQQGGKGIPPHKICGTWKAAVRLVDFTRSPPLVTVTPDPNPAKNNWNLGPEGDIPPGGFAALDNEGYGAECVWNVNDLELIPGHRYRIQFIVHDGDQNKTGGDCGESFTTAFIPPCTMKAEAIVSDYNGNNLSCKGATNGFVNLIVNGGKAPYSYSWSVPNATANLNNVGEGTYGYTVTDSKGCSVKDSVILKAPEQLNASPALSDYQGNNVRCNNSADGFINLSVTGGTAPYLYSWSVANRVNKKLSNITAGNYSYTVTDANGCSMSNAAVLTAPNPLNVPSTVSDYNGSNISCVGSTNGFINLSVSGGVGPYTYSWSQGSTTQNISNLGAGTYSYSVTDKNGCSFSDSKTLLAPNAINSPSVLSNYNGSNVSCNGSTNGFINLSVSGGTAPYSYSWSPGGSTTQNLNNIGAGTYTYTVTDANNCVSSKAVMLIAPNPISIPVTISNFNGSNVSCSGSNNGFIHLNVSGGTGPYVYSWLPGGSTTQNLDNIGAGTYAYSVTDANGCSSNNSRTLVAPNAIASPSTVSNFNGSNVSCNGSTNGYINLSVTGGTAPYSYTWSPGGSTTQNLNNIGAGTYTYSVTDANGCTTNNSRTLVAPNPLASPNTVSNFNGNNVSCNGSTNGFIHLSVTGGTAPYSYSWSPGGSTTQNLDNIGAGTYAYSVTDANGCSSSNSRTLVAPNPLASPSRVSDFNGSNVSCNGSTNGFIHLTVTGGTAPYSYSWSPGGSTTQNLNNIGAGTYTYSVTDANGCGSNNTRTLVAPGPMSSPSTVSNFNGSNVSCSGSTNGFIHLSVSGGTAPYAYAWSPGGSTTQNLNNIGAGTYSYTVTDANNCTTSNAVTLLAPNSLSIPVTVSNFNGSNVSCNGSTNGFIHLNVSGGTGPYAYSWSSGGSTTQNLDNIGAGTYSYRVTDANGCTNSNSRTLTAPNPMASPNTVSNFNGSNVSCSGSTNGFINLSVTGGTAPYSYSWSSGGSTTQNLNNIGAGTYSYTVTDANNCNSSNAVTLVAPNPLSTPATVSDFNGSNVSCSSSTNGFIHLNVSGGTGPYVYSWSPGGSTTPNLDNIGAGTYTYSVTDANGCSRSNSRTLVAPNPMASPNTVSNFNGSNVSCYGSTNGFINLSVSGGTAPYSYTWLPGGSTSQNLTNLGAGTYRYTVTDANGCTNANTVVLQAPGALNAPSVVSDYNGSNVSCNGTTNGFINLNVSGGKAPYSYAWSPGGSTSPNLTNLGAGIYSFTVTDLNGCMTSNSVTLSAPNPLNSPSTVSNYLGSNVSCTASTNGFINLTVSGGTGPYTYFWSPGGSTSQNLNNIGAGTYSYIVTDANGCTSNNTVVLAAPDPLHVPTVLSDFNGSNISCSGSTDGFIHLTAIGGTAPYTYLWSPNVSTSQNLNNLGAGTYAYTVTDANGCVANDSITLTTNNPIQSLQVVSNYNETNLSCYGSTNGFIHLTINGGTGPYSYSWSPGGSTSQNLNNVGAGTYVYTVTDANGCFITNSVTLHSPDPINAPTTVSNYGGTNVSCNGNTNGYINLTVTGGTGTYSYAWSPGGSTTQNLTNIGAGTYSFTVTDLNGCTAANSVTLIEPNPLDAVSVVSNFNGSNVSCHGSTNGFIHLTPSGGTGTYSYNWNPTGSTTQNLNNLGAGTYLYTVTDVNGCSYSNSVTLDAPDTLNAPSVASDYNGTGVSCSGSTNGYIHLSVSGGSTPYTYFWSPVVSTSQDLNNIGAGTYVYQVTDANGCIQSDSVTLTSPNPISSIHSISSYNGFNISCNGGTDGFIDETVNGGVGPYGYNWTPGNYSTQDLSNIGAGLFVLTVTDANGCVAIDSTTLTEPDLLIVNGVATDALCFGVSNGSISIAPVGGVPNFDYFWSNGTTSQNITGLGAGIHTVIITDANGCVTSNSFPIVQPNAVASTLSSPMLNGNYNVSCNGSADGSASSTALGGTLPYTYLWSNGQTTQAITNLTAGAYSLIILDANGCSVSNNITISQPPPINVNAGVDQRVCGNATVLEAGNFTGGFTGTWSVQSGTAIISNLNDPHASVTGLSYGSNVLQLFLTDGTCSATTDLMIEAFEASAAAAGESDSLCPKKAGGYLLRATPALLGTGNWISNGPATVLNPTNPQSEISGLSTGNNSFIWTVNNGPCVASDEIMIYLKEQRDCYEGLEMPTAFTPNGDGVNDDFDIHDIERYPFNSLSVFNRWGNKVYFADNYENHQWKGNNTQGEELPDATYFVILVIKDSSIKLHGYVDIRR